MSKFQLVFDGEEPEDELFDSYEEAEEHAIYLQSCQRQGRKFCTGRTQAITLTMKKPLRLRTTPLFKLVSN